MQGLEEEGKSGENMQSKGKSVESVGACGGEEAAGGAERRSADWSGLVHENG